MILTHSLHVGGAEKHVYDLISNIDSNKYRFVVVCLYELGSIGESLLGHENITVYTDLMKNKIDIAGILKLISILKKEGIDILYIVHTPLTLFWGILCAKLCGIKAALTRFTSTFPTYHVKRRRLINWIALPFVNVIVAQASHHRDYLINNEGAREQKVVVIHNGVNIERFSNHIDKADLSQEIGITSIVPIIGITANLRPEKGHAIFLSAAKIVIDEIPQTHFLIVGDGVERSKLVDLSEDLKIDANVHFMGLRNDVANIIHLFDVAVLASDPAVETFSNAILEYMAASKPVIATDVGSISEQVQNGKTGIIIPHRDPHTMAEAILLLLKNRDLAKKMGREGRRVVQNKFSVNKMIDKYELLFDDILSKRRE